MNKSSYLLIPVFLLALFSCKKEDPGCIMDEEILSKPLDLKIERLEDEFFQAKTASDFLFLLEKHPEFAESYLSVSSYPNKDSLAEELVEIHRDTLLQELYQEVKINFAEIDSLETELKQAFQYIQFYFPEFKVPKVYTFVSGFGSDIYLDKDILVIGLDYFLPITHRFQPPDLPQYITERYQKPYIVPMVVTAISAAFNKTDLAQNNLLAEVIYYGKSYHFTKAILPCTSDEYIIGYTMDQIRACFDNEELIWSHFVENDLLFETNPFVIRKYTGEAPATDEISPDAPGRLGRWLGWNIVDDYVFNQNVGLKELMEETDTEKIFKLSGYKPRR
ncbi:GldB [Mariniradius saccharolyticus AK6]|uniref:GldB n=1 Tax=Mariniradius saccharolyticus AK6 TaxID=1239962 RepID=M7XDJ7_9BACT|nr:gliding motility lipoprotein GldB [Mariniradius saccharolyticus]EMS32944.1 GldB [Mariniradius saccharolyticus AK6]